MHFSVLSRLPVTALVVAAMTAAAAMQLACGASRDAEDDATAESEEGLSKVPSFKVDLTQTSASGLSSGAFMAVQFHVAFSSTMKGVAVFAGGPFGCAQGSALNAVSVCTKSKNRLDTSPFIAETAMLEAAGAIDPVQNLRQQRVFLFGGAEDGVVTPPIMDALRDYYDAYVGAASLTYVRARPGTGHTMPTVSYGGDCKATSSPFVGNCGYDGAGEALRHIYGELAPKSASPEGTMVEVPQGDFIDSPSSHSVADNAYAYIPKSCARGETCRVHVAFHGCMQGATTDAGDAFHMHAGYNEWADENHLVILYPQAKVTSGKNPYGCWDWWGYDSFDYAKKSGPQMSMVKAMVDHLAGRGQLDSGARCAIASNADHVAAGRARAAYGLAFAAGSQQTLGAATSRVKTRLWRIAPSFWVASSCR